MDPKFTAFPDYVNDSSNVEDETFLASYGQFSSPKNGFDYHVPSPDLSFMDVPSIVSLNPEPSTFTPSASVPNDDSEFSDPVLKYINQILMEENIGNMSWEDQDSLALRNTEQSLYQVLREQHNPPVDQIVETPESVNENGSINHSTPFPGTSAGDGLIAKKNMFSDEESISQFNRGFEEGSKFLPKIDIGSSDFASNLKARVPNAFFKEDRNEGEQPPDGSKETGSRRKNLDREESYLEEERSTKQLAISAEVGELSELFDKVLLFKSRSAEDETVKRRTLGTKKDPIASTGGRTRTKRKEKEKETSDLSNLLILCAQAVSSDYRNANGLLKMIRENASPFGDGFQRLAHYFANGLEARIKGDGSRIQSYYGSIASMKTTAADIMRAYNVIMSALAYELPNTFACQSICKMAEKAKALHIVDFGINFGFQWPSLIESLSKRDGGPPKLRITGIELPQRGFRPAEGIEETGRLLACYCERFNVPFEYNGIVLQDWESLRLEDLKLDSSEMLAVNNLYRFEYLLDESETVEVESPRDAVLRIIRSMKPDIFVHFVVNGSFSGPFFVSRFKEALLYYSVVFDAYDTTLSREEPARIAAEDGVFGREIMSVVACEGSERNYRPESYRKWQVRVTNAGFKQMPLDQELLRMLRKKQTTQYYHKDFVIEDDGNWTVQGWKGRILNAWSCWVPS